MKTGLDYLEDHLSDSRDLLMGDHVSIADCTLQAGCQFVRFGKLDVLQDHPNLSAWDALPRRTSGKRGSKILVRQKNLWASCGSGSLPSV